jgi:hypothetical protein
MLLPRLPYFYELIIPFPPRSQKQYASFLSGERDTRVRGTRWGEKGMKITEGGDGCEKASTGQNPSLHALEKEQKKGWFSRIRTERGLVPFFSSLCRQKKKSVLGGSIYAGDRATENVGVQLMPGGPSQAGYAADTRRPPPSPALPAPPLLHSHMTPMLWVPQPPPPTCMPLPVGGAGGSRRHRSRVGPSVVVLACSIFLLLSFPNAASGGAA